MGRRRISIQDRLQRRELQSEKRELKKLEHFLQQKKITDEHKDEGAKPDESISRAEFGATKVCEEGKAELDQSKNAEKRNDEGECDECFEDFVEHGDFVKISWVDS